MRSGLNLPTINFSVDSNTDIRTKTLYYLFIAAVYFTNVGIFAALGVFCLIIGVYLILSGDAPSVAPAFLLLGFPLFFGPHYYFYSQLMEMQINLMHGGGNKSAIYQQYISNISERTDTDKDGRTTVITSAMSSLNTNTHSAPKDPEPVTQTTGLCPNCNRRVFYKLDTCPKCNTKFR